MSHVVPSSDGISLNSDLVSRDGKHHIRPRYLENFLTDSQTQCQPPNARWHCIVQNFLAISTLHGVGHLRPPSTTKQKCFWLVAILACGTFLLVHASVLIYNAATRPSLSTTLTLKYRDLDGPLLNEHDEVTKFPGITICGLIPFKRKESQDSFSSTMYHALSLGYPYSGLTLEEKIILQKIVAKSEEWSGFNISVVSAVKKRLEEFTLQSVERSTVYEILSNNSYSCSEIFSSCYLGFESLNCCDIFEPILTTYGFCYALQVERTSLGEIEMETLPFIIDLNTASSTTVHSEEGYLLLVHDPRFTPRMVMSKDGLLVPPGVAMSLRLTLRITDYSAKYLKWFGLATDCPTVACMGEDYSIQECVFQIAASKINELCECSWILDDCNNASNAPVCGAKEMIGCVATHTSKLLGELLKMCQPPCSEYIFESTSSYAQLRYNNSFNERSRISISYNTISYYHNIYHKHYLSSLFSDIGGAMGLLLGASCLTGVELLIFLGQWIYFTFLDRKAKGRTKPS